MTVPFKTCLLIDDNYIDNFVTRRVLESNNFAEQIIVRQSPTEAIELLKDGSVDPDVIFLDIRMPVMDGFEFLHEFDGLAIAKKGVKIYMLSSSLDPTDIRLSADNKYITQFIHKPLTNKVLEEICL
ncbi:CheY-like chemotaxis protein [Mucilaginibacter oryzae]|uniref:CheY-like chemotaxis protein n=1 Tax=Mucilaginibacter oryzae TaxID=468058 RepID=A0A316GV09_9SPHI|nr:response regulator [Mucilaginibacter oryzae]PWK67654.1 CheY-like chemotaxis protein [Mucilaginibacter oryzae]